VAMLPGGTALDRARCRSRADGPPDSALVSSQLKAVVFDLGGVLTLTGRPTDLAKRYPDHPAEQVIELVMGKYHLDTDHQWHRLERGEITMEACRAETKLAMEALGIKPVGPPPNLAQGPNFLNNEAMLTLVRDLRAAGHATAMLTNNVREFRPMWWPLAPWDELFDVIVDSHEVGMRKPNPAIYRLTLERLGIEPGRSAFVDDVASNVAAAESIGMFGVVVDEDFEPAIARVRELAGLA
jgi:putative hydrolase of the HAD superfamily